MFFNKYPYTDFHELNLDWIIEKIGKLENDQKGTLDANIVTPEQFGAVGDGIRDDAPAFRDMIANTRNKAVLLTKSYALYGAVTIPADVNLVFNHGKIIVVDGILSIESNVSHDIEQIFDGSGTVKLNGNSEVYPEWFGAKNDTVTDCTNAFNKCVDALSKGNIILQGGFHHIYTMPVPLYGYRLSDTITIRKSEIGIIGINKAVIISNADICLTVEGTNVADRNLGYLDGFNMSNVCIVYNGNKSSTSDNASSFHALTLKGCLRFKVHDIEVNNYGCGVWLKNNVNCYLENVIYNSPVSGAYNIAFYVDENLDGAIFANASLYISKCSCTANTSATIGILAKGSTTADLFIDQFEMGGGTTGISVSNEVHGNENRTMTDLHVNHCVLDGVMLGIEITGNLLENSLVDIGDNWIASGSNGIAAINLVSCINVNVHGNNLNGINSPASFTGVIFNGCYGCMFVNNLIEGCNKGVTFAGTGDDFAILGNTFNTRKIVDSATYTHLVFIPVSVGHVNVSNNTHFFDDSLVFTPYIVQSNTNVLNYNYTAFDNSIADGNIVNGQVI